MVHDSKTLSDLAEMAKEYKKPFLVVMSDFDSMKRYKELRFKRLYDVSIPMLFYTSREKYFDYCQRLDNESVKDLYKRYERQKR